MSEFPLATSDSSSGIARPRGLILIADPRRGSYSHRLATCAASGLAAAGFEVDTVDLYGIGFRAAMSAQERAAYHGDNPIVESDVRTQAELVARANVLVFVYPTVVSGLPAILKGWFDRVLVPGVAFRFDDEGRVRPALGHVRLVVGVSTYDEPHWKVRLRYDNGRRTLTRALHMNCDGRATTNGLGSTRHNMPVTSSAESSAPGCNEQWPTSDEPCAGRGMPPVEHLVRGSGWRTGGRHAPRRRCRGPLYRPLRRRPHR